MEEVYLIFLSCITLLVKGDVPVHIQDQDIQGNVMLLIAFHYILR